MKVTEIKNTKYPYEVYKKDGKDWVKFNHAGENHDLTAQEAFTLLIGAGLLFLAFAILMGLDLEKETNTQHRI